MQNRAVLIAINQYPGAPLEGCINDQINVGNLLRDHGYLDQEIRRLRDRDCTTQNILDVLGWLVSGPEPVRALFHFSGHGTLVNDIDNYDALCPVDFDWSMEHMITDRQLVPLLGRMPKGSIFGWISDSCHSGSLAQVERGLVGHNHPRSYPIPTHTPKTRMLSRGPSRSITNGILDCGFISGCRSDQTSSDTRIDGQPCGAATYYITKAIRAYPMHPITMITREANDMLRQAGYSQQPCCCGTQIDQPFLGA